MQPNLFHTFPYTCLDYLADKAATPIFVEAHVCLQNRDYSRIVCDSSTKSVLDCGVGASPDLSNPMAHVNGDPSFGVKYLSLMLLLEPDVMIVPDVLGDRKSTYNNFLHYCDVLFSLDKSVHIPDLMYVIQGQTKQDALDAIDEALSFKQVIKWIGFPRVVHYYGVGHTLAKYLSVERLQFVSDVYDKIIENGIKVHLLGMNSVEELKWAAQHRASIDTRTAALAAAYRFNVLEPRPYNVKLDLNKEIDEETKTKILYNIEKLNDIFYGNINN